MTFVSEYLLGKTEIENIDDWVDDWNNGVNNSNKLGLRDYLGFTKSEYGLWLVDPCQLYNQFRAKRSL